MIPIFFLAVVLGVACGVISFLRDRQSRLADRLVRGILPACGVLAVGLALRHAVYVVYPAWGAARVAVTDSLALGYSLYYPKDSGPVLGVVYTPLYFLFYLPVTLFATPTAAILAGALLSCVYAMAPQFWLYLKTERLPERAPLWTWGCAICSLVLACSLFAITYAIFPVRGDAPMLGLCMLACGLIYYHREPGWRVSLLSAALVALAVWTKQTAVIAVLALPLFLWVADGWRTMLRYAASLGITGAVVSLGFGLFLPLEAFFFRTVQYPARHPWFRYSCFQPDAPPGSCTVATSWLDRLVSMGWMAQKYLNEYLWVFLLAGILVALSLSRWGGGASPTRAWLCRHRWTAFLFLALLAAPMGIASRVKTGGEDSAFALCLYFFLPVLLLGARDLAAQSPPANSVAKVLVVAVLLFSLAASLSKFASFPRLLAGLPDNPHEAAYRYLKRHPGRAYFPFTPLASILAQKTAYHYDWVIQEMRSSGFPVSPQHFQAYIPPGFEYIAYPPNFGDYQPRTALKLLPEFSEQVQLAELPGWAVFRRPAANSQKHP